MSDPKAHFRHYLQQNRDALLWKLEGLSEYDVRRPLTPTGTNLLGLVKHVACMEAVYLGAVFGRPFPGGLPWIEDDAEVNADMWATAGESREFIVDLYRRAATHADATIEALDLDATGRVPWWAAERNTVTVHQILVHLLAEVTRHTGQADILREEIDGAAGMRREGSNLPDGDATWWETYRERLEHTARQAGDAAEA